MRVTGDHLDHDHYHHYNDHHHQPPPLKHQYNPGGVNNDRIDVSRWGLLVSTSYFVIINSCRLCRLGYGCYYCANRRSRWGWWSILGYSNRRSRWGLVVDCHFWLQHRLLFGYSNRRSRWGWWWWYKQCWSSWWSSSLYAVVDRFYVLVNCCYSS